jgi:hypothetical protein
MAGTFNPLIRSNVTDTLNRALREAEDKSEEIFRARRQMCADYFFDRVLAEDNGDDGYLKEFFAYENEKGALEYPSYLGLEHVPITRKIARKKAKVYKVQPIRKVGGNPAEDYQALLDLSSWSAFSKKVDQLTYLLNDICVGVYVSQDKTRLMPRLYTDFVPLFDGNDPFQPVAVVVPTSWVDAKGAQVWAYFDAENMWLCTSKGDRTDVEGVQQGPHNYGALPFIFPHYDFPVDHFFGTPRVALIQANQQIDVAKTSLNQVMKMQGYKQVVIVGNTGDTASKVVMGKSRALVLTPSNTPSEVQPSASVLDMQPDFVGHIEGIKFGMELAAFNENVNIRWRIEGGAQSGVAMKIQDMDDLEDRYQTVEVYQDFIERPLYEKVAAYRKANILSAPVEQGEFMADFADIDYPETVDETASRETHELTNNLTNAIRLIKQRNPDLTDEQAAKEFLVNRKVNGLTAKRGLSVESILATLQPTPEELAELGVEPDEPEGEGVDV